MHFPQAPDQVAAGSRTDCPGLKPKYCYADRALLLYGDGRYRLGPVAEVLTAEELSALYLTPICAIGAPPRRAFIAA